MRSTRSLSWIRGLLGLEPAPLPPHVFAIDATSVRYGCFPRAAAGLESREYHEVALPEETFGVGLVGCALQEERSLREGLDDLLSRLSMPPTEASVVLPDSWLRLIFTETGDLPRPAKEREEILRWKLKQLVPFRVDDLRLRTVEVTPLIGSDESRRVMIGFGLEMLLGQIETAFSSYGIRVGWVSNVSLSLLEAVWEAVGKEGLAAVVSVTPDGYSLTFADSGSVVLHRFRALDARHNAQLGSSVLRELRLTRSFVDERLAGLGAVHLFVTDGDEAGWREWVADGLGATEIRSGSEFVHWGGRPIAAETWRVAPLMGAACRLMR